MMDYARDYTGRWFLRRILSCGADKEKYDDLSTQLQVLVRDATLSYTIETHAGVVEILARIREVPPYVVSVKLSVCGLSVKNVGHRKKTEW